MDFFKKINQKIKGSEGDSDKSIPRENPSDQTTSTNHCYFLKKGEVNDLKRGL